MSAPKPYQRVKADETAAQQHTATSSNGGGGGIPAKAHTDNNSNSNHNGNNNAVVVYLRILRALASNAWATTSSLILVLFAGRGRGAGGGGNSKKAVITAGDVARHGLLLAVKLAAPVAVLVGIPLLVLKDVPADRIWIRVESTWDALFHTSIRPIVAVTVLLTAHAYHSLRQSGAATHGAGGSRGQPQQQQQQQQQQDGGGRECISRRTLATISPYKKAFFYVMVVVPVLVITHSQVQVVIPSVIWSPFLWGRYQVYLPRDIPQSLTGLCLDGNGGEKAAAGPGSSVRVNSKDPLLCLPEGSWEQMSSGALSSQNPADVEAVRKGLRYARDVSGGLIVNIMSRDTIDAIEPLRYNVEGLLPFFPNNKLSVVVFENDSKDGSREAFKRWAAEADGYSVDLISCGEDNPDCKYGVSHRYDSTEAKDYFMSSAIGKMADYRQRIVDHVVGDPRYSDYSHMLVLDLDLKVSLSPLGVLHSLGTVPDAAVASSGRQIWPGSLGTLQPPYDFSAFRPIETPKNQHLVNLHSRFCGLLPEGDRWRNQCDAASSIQLLFILSYDWLFAEEPYPVASAFNGATIYPLGLVRETAAKYDAGTDGQRCEHIGFNMGLKKPMYVNPKWNMHVSPSNPGGPTGMRSLRSVIRIVFTPRLGWLMFFQLVGFLTIFVACLMSFTLHLLQTTLSAAQSFSDYQRMVLKMKEQREQQLPVTVLNNDNDNKENAEVKQRLHAANSTTIATHARKRTVCASSDIRNTA